MFHACMHACSTQCVSSYLPFRLLVEGKGQPGIGQDPQERGRDSPKETDRTPIPVVAGQGFRKSHVAGGPPPGFGPEHRQLRAGQIQWVRGNDADGTGRHAGPQAFQRRQTPVRFRCVGAQGFLRVVAGFLLPQEVCFVPVEHHELDARVGEDPNQRGEVALPQGGESLVANDAPGNPGNVRQVELGGRDLVQYFYSIKGRHDALGHHSRESSRENVPHFFWQFPQFFQTRRMWIWMWMWMWM